jgi:hemoglobin-like flavoprotein
VTNVSQAIRSTEGAMTAEQCRLVRQTFDRLHSFAGPFALLFYGRLFEVDPSARRLFHNDLAVQGRKLMDTLDWVAESLDRFDAMRTRLADLGRKHASYGVRPEQYDTVTTALLWALSQALGPDFDAPTRAAWTVALAQISAAMKAAV